MLRIGVRHTLLPEGGIAYSYFEKGDGTSASNNTSVPTKEREATNETKVKRRYFIDRHCGDIS